MNGFHQTTRTVPWALVWAFCLAAITGGCGDDRPAKSIRPSQQAATESFTFFDLGARSRLTKTVRGALADHLGSDAIERRATIDLDIGPGRFLEKHFKELYRLHRSLNSDIGARVEHPITRLTYRYPDQKNTPFKFVRLVFANETDRPLYFRIVLKKEGSAIVETLRQKYGPPQSIGTDGQDTQILYWEKNGDTLLVAQTPDRFGNPEYHMMIYFVANLKDLLATEKKAAARREKELKQAGKTAF